MDTLTLTGEEILVYAMTRGFEPPSFLADLELIRLDPEAAEQRLVEAGRALATRGVEITAREPGAPPPSTTDDMLAAVCDPSAELCAVTFVGELVRQRRFVRRQDLVVEQAWNDAGIHALRLIGPQQVAGQLIEAAGEIGDDATPTGWGFATPIESLSSAAQQGESALASFVAQAMSQTGQPAGAAAALAASMVSGSRSAASLRTRDGRVEVITWIDADGSGLWSYGPASDAPDGDIRFNCIGATDLRDALNRLSDLFVSMLVDGQLSAQG